MSERSTEEHNGHTNYETWAFMAHVTQTQSLVDKAIEIARTMVEQDYYPAVVGDEVVRRFKDWAIGTVHYPEWFPHPQPEEWKNASLMLQDVGSWWRIDDASIGRQLTEYVRELV